MDFYKKREPGHGNSRTTLRLVRTCCAIVLHGATWRRRQAQDSNFSDGRKPLRAALEHKLQMAMLGTSMILQNGWALLKFVCCGSRSSRVAAAVTIHMESPRASSRIADANQGASALCVWSLRR